MYTIVDIETTGNGIKGNKITEISIFKFDGSKVVDEFTSLVNPECDIPYFITGLTGIDNDLVRNAPTLGEIAPKIEAITEGCIFVAHSVNFDYNVIKNEFKELDRSFVRKKLCTVRLSRKLFPGLHSYSLGKLCSSLEIPIQNRHRARGDAQATVTLFQRLLNKEGANEVVQRFLNARSQEATLPPDLPRKVYEKLPTAPGVYYFKNGQGKIIYIGKAINIKKRVLGHFYDKATKEVRLCRETADIDFELSGNELVALLMESAAIKHHFPIYNRAQKRNIAKYGIFAYEDRKGILHLAYNNAKLISKPLVTFYNIVDCRTYLEYICASFGLCAKFCHLQEGVAHCAHFKIPQCEGICRGRESKETYNSKVQRAIESMGAGQEDYIIKEKGRAADEEAVILVKNGMYHGYGFVPKDTPSGSMEDLMAFIAIQKNTLESQRLVETYMLKNPEKVETMV